MKRLYRITVIAEVNGTLDEDDVFELLSDQNINGAHIISTEAVESAEDYELDEDEDEFEEDNS